MTNHAAASSFTAYLSYTAYPGLLLIPVYRLSRVPTYPGSRFTAYPSLPLIPGLSLLKPARVPLTSAAPEYKDL